MSNKEDVVMLDDLDTFVTVLSQWHASKVAMLEHMRDVPEGTEVSFDENDPQILKGSLLKGYIMGINLSLMELGKLPFVTETGDNTVTEGDLFSDDSTNH